MTIGANAEYELSSELEPQMFLELSDDLLRIIQVAQDSLANVHTASEARGTADIVNEALMSEGVPGRTARLISDDMSVLSHGVTEDSAGELIPAGIKVDIAKRQYQGVFMECEAISADDTYYDFYFKMQLPLDTDGLQFRTVMAPVASSRLLVETKMIEVTDSEELREPIALLSSIEDDIVIECLDAIVDLLNARPAMSAELLQDISSFMTDMMACQAFIDTPGAQEAALALFSPVISVPAWCELDGVEYTIRQLPDGTKDVDYQTVGLKGEIHAIVPTQDFYFDKSGRAVLKDTKQPSLVFLDDDNVEHLFPITHLETFKFLEETTREEEERSWREKFLSQNPDLFKKRSKFGSFLRRYFQNDSDGV